MYKKVIGWVVLYLIFGALTGCSVANGPGERAENDWRETVEYEEQSNAKAEPLLKEVDYSTYFAGLTGAAVLLDSDGAVSVYNRELAEKPASPCSSFKIPSTLLILETGAVGPEEKLAWDGTGWRFPAWNQDIALREAYQASCVWYYRQAIDRIGPEHVQNRLSDWSYGNCDISQWEGSGFNGIATADGFWLESSLLISPLEQVAALKHIFASGSAAPEHLQSLKDIMRDEGYEGDGAVYGKTGSGKGAWYVGFFENGSSGPVYFAVRLAEQEGASSSKAKEILFRIIKEMDC